MLTHTEINIKKIHLLQIVKSPKTIDRIYSVNYTSCDHNSYFAYSHSNNRANFSSLLPRDAMHKRGIYRHAVSVCLCVCVCLCVRHVRELRQNE